VPYALALGAWVSITAVIPYLGAWLGAIPALLVAFSISPTAAALTGVLFLVIQQQSLKATIPGTFKWRNGRLGSLNAERAIGLLLKLFGPPEIAG
jgi:hypothetical protein